MIETRIDNRGYSILTKIDRRKRAIYQHVLVAEQMFGGPLPNKMVVHHLDCNQENNSPENLMICSQSYHKIQHRRIDSMNAVGLSWYIRCQYCGKYDNPKDMCIRPNGRQASHRKCSRESTLKSYRKNKDGINERRRQRRANNPEETKTKARRYWAKNKNHILKREKLYREKRKAACEAFMEVEM